MNLKNTIIEQIQAVSLRDPDKTEQDPDKTEQDSDKPEQKIVERDCIELKNLEYKNVIMYGNNIKPRDESVNVSVLEDLLERESQMNRLDLWSKLDKTDKIIKLKAYTKKMTTQYSLTDEEAKLLDSYFLYCLERKYLQKIKEVIYSRETGIIDNIPALTFNEETRTFTLKKGDKHGNTLKSLTPKTSQNKTKRI